MKIESEIAQSLAKMKAHSKVDLIESKDIFCPNNNGQMAITSTELKPVLQKTPNTYFT